MLRKCKPTRETQVVSLKSISNFMDGKNEVEKSKAPCRVILIIQITWKQLYQILDISIRYTGSVTQKFPVYIDFISRAFLVS